jgi:hypothetical protein
VGNKWRRKGRVEAVLWIRIRDPGSSAFLTPGSGIRDGKQIGSGFRIRIRDDQPGSYFLELRNHFLELKYLNSLVRIRDPGSGMETIFWVKILKFFDSDADPDPGSGMEKFGSGINIPDPQHWEKQKQKDL